MQPSDAPAFFSGTAVVTFGGVYAVLAYVAQNRRGGVPLAHRGRHGPRPRAGRDTLYFAVHTPFATSTRHHWGPINLDLPNLNTWRPVALLIAILAAVLIFQFKVSVLRTLGICAAVGLTAGLTGLPLR